MTSEAHEGSPCEPFQGDNLIFHSRPRQQARPRWLAVAADRTGAAVPKPAAELGPWRLKSVRRTYKSGRVPANRRNGNELGVQPTHQVRPTLAMAPQEGTSANWAVRSVAAVHLSKLAGWSRPGAEYLLSCVPDLWGGASLWSTSGWPRPACHHPRHWRPVAVK